MGRSILGWDIGGANIKAALVAGGEPRGVRTRAFELQRDPARLVTILIDMAGELCAEPPAAHAVTMTAELSQMFRTKREGVSFVLDAVEAAFSGTPILVYATDGTFVSTAAARQQPLLVAAANWVATAHVAARHHRDALLVDVGTTTTDLIPIAGGRVAAAGRTDPERLAYRELVYTGAVRTPVEAIVRDVPVAGGSALVSAEGFALSGDVHVWLGVLRAEDYDAATPDGRPSARPFCGERLARVVCADRKMLDEDAITVIARAIADAQAGQIAAAIAMIRARHASLRTAVVTGLGAFIGTRAARAAGLEVLSLASQLGDAGARSAPATAVALLLDESGGVWNDGVAAGPRQAPVAAALAGAGSRLAGGELTVIKLGGGLLADPARWRAAMTAIATAASSRPMVVVPGGGPFADAVRGVDARVGLSDDAAHWMAIAGMDQHAEMIAAGGPEFVRVVDAAGVEAALRTARVPVVAPLQWLRAADPLPHSWDVTSDSIAAWLAGALGATRLLLVKPEGAAGAAMLDPYFSRALPPNLEWRTSGPVELEARLRALEPSRR